MKIAILGAGGVRTPLIVEAMIQRQAKLGIDELALMDVNAERLETLEPLWLAEDSGPLPFSIHRTTDARSALAGADFVITTFRVGLIRSRIVDERVPLRYGVLGQETTGPGGFAMAMRTIPVLLDYIALMREVCPDAWLLNFANPAGLLAEAAIQVGGWPRTVGICDAPEAMRRVAAALQGTSPDALYLDYFGLNHLGWVRSVRYLGRDYLPNFIARVQAIGKLPALPFSVDFIASLGMIPNEYLFYYYHNRQAVANLLAAPQTRGEMIAAWNEELFAGLRATADLAAKRRLYRDYISRRGDTYMTKETGQAHSLDALDTPGLRATMGQGYAGVALDMVEALTGATPRQIILNVPNAGAIDGMGEHDVVEVPTYVGQHTVQPISVGAVPAAPLGLMAQVKAYERLTIAAATEGSYAKAVQALTIHPLVRDRGLAEAILADYRAEHGALFPELR